MPDVVIGEPGTTWTNEAGAAGLLAELGKFNMVRVVSEHAPARAMVVLTDFGADVAGFVADPGGCRWVRAQAGAEPSP